MPKLNVGEKFPNFTVDTAYEKGLALYDLIGDKTVIWFLRYIGCPPCHADLQTAIDRYDEVTAKGGRILFVMQSDQAHIAAPYPQGSVPVTVLCDPEQKLYQALDIRPADTVEELLGPMEKLMAKGKKAEELGFTHGDYEGNEQQLPAMFMVNRDGTITYARYAANITDLPDLDGVLAML